MFYFKSIPLELEVPGYPKEYPAYFIFNEEDIISLKSILSKAIMNGIEPEYRKLCFSPNCKEGIKLKDLMNIIDDKSNFQIINETEARVYMSIPHWNPVEDLLNILNEFNATAKEMKTSGEIDKNTEEILNSAKKVSQYYKLFYEPDEKKEIL